MQRKRILTFFLLALLVLSLFSFIPSTFSTEIFSDGFETGDFGEWDGTIGSPTVQDVIVYSGDYAMNASFTANWQECIAYTTFSQTYLVFARWYFQVSALPNTNGYYMLGEARDSVSGSVWKARIYQNATSYYFRLTSDELATSFDYAWSLSTDEWYCLEIKYLQDESVGEFRVWLDDVEVITETGKSVTRQINYFRVGAYSENSGNYPLYIFTDSVVISDEYNGPEEGADIEVFVDNNTSDEDESADVGTQGNFTTQQYADSINDTLTEANVPGYNEVIQYFNSTSSDVDESADVGTETDPANAQDYAPDSDYMTLQEANQGGGGGLEYLNVDGFNSVNEEWDENGGSPWLDNSTANYVSTDVDEEWHEEFTFTNTSVGTGTISNVDLYIEINGPSARNDYVVVDLHDGSDWTNIANQDPDGDAYVWYNFDVSGTLDSWTKIDVAKLRIQYQRSGSPSTQTIYVRRSYLNVSYSGSDYELDFEYQWTSADYDETTESVCVYVQTASQGGENLVAYEWNNVDTWVSLGTLSSDGWNNFTASYLTDSTYTINIRDSDQDNEETQSTWSIDCIITNCSSTPTNYRLDLEEQWTDLTTNYQNEELCIYAGDFSGAEDLQVKVWHSSSWNWVMNLTANSWNNVSVSSYLDSVNFTIQFLDGIQSDDSTQNTWDKECALLHLWNVTGEEEYIYGAISSKVTINYAKLLTVARYCDASPLLSIASLTSKSVDKYIQLSVTQVKTVDSSTTVQITKLQTIQPQFSLFSSDSWSLSRYGSVYEILTFDGWLEKLQQLDISGDLTALLIVDSSLEWAVVKYGDVEIICQITDSKNVGLTFFVSVNPVFVIVGNYSEEAANIEQLYGIIGQVLGVDSYNLYVFERIGDVTETIAIATTKDVSLEELASILAQMGIDGVSFKELLKDITIAETFQIDQQKSVTFALFKSVNQTSVIASIIEVFSSLWKWFYGSVSQVFTINSLQNILAPYGTGQDIFVRGKGIFFIAVAIALAFGGLVMMKRKKKEDEL